MLKKSFLFICFVVAGSAQSASNLSSNNIQKTLKAVDDLLAEDTLNWSDDVQNIYAKLAQLKVNALSDYHCHMFNRECTSPTPYIQLSKKYEELVAKLNLTLGEEDKVSFDSLQVWYDRLEVSEREKLKSAFIPQAHSLNVVQAPKNRKEISYMEWLKVYDSTSPQDWEKPCRNMTFEGLQDAYDYIDRRCPKFFSEQKYTSFLVALAAKRLELQKQLTVADAKKKKEKLGTQIDTLNRLFDTFSHKISPGSTKLKKLIVQDDIKFIKKHGTYIKNEEAENVFCNYQMGHINDSEEEVTEKIQSLLRCKEKTGKPVSRKKKKQNGESVSVLPKEDRKSADVEHLLSINSAPKEQVTILENDPFDPNQIPTQFVIHENEEEDLSEPEDQVVTVKEKEQSECNVAMITLQQQEEFKILLAGLGQYHKYLDGKDPVVEYQQAVNTIDKDRFYHLTPDFINKEQKRLIADFQQVFKYSTLPDKTYPLDLSKGAIESIVASKQSKERLKKLELDCEFNPPMLCYSTASVINWQNPAMQREMVSACRANKNIPEHCSFDDIVASHTAPTHVLETVLNHGQCYQDAQQNKLIKFFLEGTYKQGSAKPASIVMEAFFTSDCHGHIGLFHYFANPHKGTLDYAKKNDQRLPDHQTQGFVGKLNLTDDHTLCWDVVKKKASGTICITSQDALQAYVFPLKKK